MARLSVWSALALLAVAQIVVRAEDWPQFLGPRCNGISGEVGLLEQWPTNGPPLLWEKKLGAGYSAPSVRGGLLVLHHRTGDEEVIEAIDAVTAKPRWRHAYPTAFVDPYGYNNGPRCTPLLTSNRCYTFGAEGRLVCLDLLSGKFIWERQTEKDWNIPPAFFGVGSSPILEGDLLLVMVGGQPNSGMVGLDATTGKTVWENVGEKTWHGKSKTGWRGEPLVDWAREDKQASYATPLAATIHGKRHVLSLMRQGLVSLDPATGEVNFARWFRAPVPESVNAATPIVVDDMILISGAYYRVGSVLLKVKPDGRSYDELWHSTALELHWMTPIHDEGFVYGFSGRNEPDARFRCVRLKTGELMWERDESWRPYSAKQPPVYGRGSLIMADGKLIALGEGGLLGMFKLNSKQPEEIARYQVPQLTYPCWAAPVLSEKRLYLRSERYLLCFDLAKKR